ncbi:MAG: hypothetical protein Q4A17_07600 [Thermoguttaceae bacterium]|nr:hypothetical protein [Thermoguttaceae bacterium]
MFILPPSSSNPGTLYELLPFNSFDFNKIRSKVNSPPQIVKSERPSGNPARHTKPRIPSPAFLNVVYEPDHQPPYLQRGPIVKREQSWRSVFRAATLPIVVKWGVCGICANPLRGNFQADREEKPPSAGRKLARNPAFRF